MQYRKQPGAILKAANFIAKKAEGINVAAKEIEDRVAS
jgi:hypothetical protein